MPVPETVGNQPQSMPGRPGSEPKPFVLQTALNDFYVAYEINAYTREATGMATYRLAIDKGMSHQSAIHAASYVVRSHLVR